MTMKAERLEMRVTAENRRLIEKAAAVSGQAVTAFAVSHLVAKAKDVLSSHEVTTLSAVDREAFLRILDEDEPVSALVEAVRRHKAHGA